MRHILQDQSFQNRFAKDDWSGELSNGQVTFAVEIRLFNFVYRMVTRLLWMTSPKSDTIPFNLKFLMIKWHLNVKLEILKNLKRERIIRLDESRID